MDSAEKTLVEFCAGYGGIGMGLARVIPNLRTIAVCEIESFAIENLIAKMEAGRIDACPVWNDLKTFPSEQFHGLVDILSAGFPCQPFSHAGLRKGDEDERHLFPYILNAIESIRPRYVCLENVEGLISAKLGSDCWADPIGTPVLLHVLRELERRGYTATWGIFSAAEVGAPHQRKRVFILAHSTMSGYWADSSSISSSKGQEGRSYVPVIDKCSADQLAHNIGTRTETRLPEQEQRQEGESGVTHNCCYQYYVWPSRPGEPQYEWEPPRVTGGMAQFTDEGTLRRDWSEEETDTGLREEGRCGDIQRQQTQPPLGGDSHGTADRLDYAELYGADSDSGDADEYRRSELVDSELQRGSSRLGAVQEKDGEVSEWYDDAVTSHPSLYTACDNRVDELRLLGNGVVPATAARAWEVLYERLTLHNGENPKGVTHVILEQRNL